MHTDLPKPPSPSSQTDRSQRDKSAAHLPQGSFRAVVNPAGGSAGGRPRPRFITLGVFGFDQAGFFSALEQAGVDTFCDLRARRGVRGREYAFVNSRALQARLSQLNIRYFHFKELAPSHGLRQRQSAADKLQRTAKRQRTELSETFIAGYREECLHRFDSRRFIEQLGPGAHVVALFCVERTPSACHRSLLAARLQHDLTWEIVHLTPDEVVPMKS